MKATPPVPAQTPPTAVTEEEIEAVYELNYPRNYPSDTIPPSKPNKIEKNPPSVEGEPMPLLELSHLPAIDLDISPMPVIPPLEVIEFVSPMLNMDLDIADEALNLSNFSVEIAQLFQDYTPQNLKRKAEPQAKFEQLEGEMEAKSKAFENKMEIWEKQHASTIKEWEVKMKVWSKDMEGKQIEWEETYGPKMKEFEKKMKAWEKENEPKLKEYQEKMKAWKIKNFPKENGDSNN
ncbi:hypothetical protein QWY93_10145 [Echinicola jeungdonensis]|uniref:Uncharacterized protein n=1 Tax=Echinicola jeungdonensis TaxID=709343 RepID=A0ABV5J9P9_9BACT|nr:hypothetical protein [Echinicola jeungdonensis]MDN3669684.1 hypothetical protein [Echinicola jeungdonensis]